MGSRLFDDAAQDGLLYNSLALVESQPFAIVGWIRPDAAASAQIIGFSDQDGSDYLRLLQTDSGQMLAQKSTAGTLTATSTATSSVGQWAHGCAIFVADSAMRVYLNGGNVGTNGTSKSISANLDTTSIGYRKTTVDSNHASGNIAECCIFPLAGYPGGTPTEKADYFVANTLLLLQSYAASLLPSFGIALPTHRWSVGGIASPEPDSVGSADMVVTGAAPSALSPPISYSLVNISYTPPSSELGTTRNGLLNPVKNAIRNSMY